MIWIIDDSDNRGLDNRGSTVCVHNNWVRIFLHKFGSYGNGNKARMKIPKKTALILKKSGKNDKRTVLHLLHYTFYCTTCSYICKVVLSFFSTIFLL